MPSNIQRARERATQILALFDGDAERALNATIAQLEQAQLDALNARIELYQHKIADCERRRDRVLACRNPDT